MGFIVEEDVVLDIISKMKEFKKIKKYDGE